MNFLNEVEELPQGVRIGEEEVQTIGYKENRKYKLLGIG